MRQTLAFIGCLLLSMTFLAPRLSSWFAGDPAIASSTSIQPTHSPDPTPRLLTKPIEEIRCGDRILADNPEGPSTTEVDGELREELCLLRLSALSPGGETIAVNLLRHRSWLDHFGAQVGEHFDLDFEHLGIEDAILLDIEEAPAISQTDGKLVTGTFQHTCDAIAVLTLSSGETIECTPGHPIWSETKSQFVRADSLQAGEQLRSVSDALTVLSVHTNTQLRKVYNLEVDGEHVYHVGSQGLVAHNVNQGYFDRTDFIVYARSDGSYVGRTVGDLAYRYGRDASQYTVLLDNLSYEEVRGLEQMGIEAVGGKDDSSNSNTRNGIDPNRNDNRAKRYRESAKPKKKKLLEGLRKCR